MKKFVIFSLSFIVLFIVFQILSGYILTLFYMSDISSAWHQADNLTNTTAVGKVTSFLPLIIAFLAAIIAVFIPKLFREKKCSK